jgi:hypothetical protein
LESALTSLTRNIYYFIGGGYGGVLWRGMWHTWRATRVDFACIYLVLLLLLSISLESTLVETLLAILGDIYFIISWSFEMIKTLIPLYLLGFVLWRWSTYYFGV